MDKWRLALSLLDQVKGKVPYEAITFDAGYGEVRDFLADLDQRKERFVGQIPESHGFWLEEVEITTTRSNRGRPRKHPVVPTEDTNRFRRSCRGRSFRGMGSSSRRWSCRCKASELSKLWRFGSAKPTPRGTIVPAQRGGCSSSGLAKAATSTTSPTSRGVSR